MPKKFPRKAKKTKAANVSTIKTFGLAQVKLMNNASGLNWLPNSSSDQTNSSSILKKSIKINYSNNIVEGKRVKNLSLFNTFESEGEEAFQENKKPKVDFRKKTKKKTIPTKPKKKTKQFSSLFSSKHLNNNAEKSNNVSILLLDRKRMFDSLGKSQISLHGSVIKQGPEVIPEASKEIVTNNVQSTPFVGRKNSPPKKLPEPLQISPVNDASIDDENLNPISPPFSDTFSPEIIDNSNMLDERKKNPIPCALSVTSLNSTVLNHGPEVLPPELIHFENKKPRGRRRHVELVKGTIHSTPAVIRVDGRREVKLLTCKEQLQMSESLRDLAGNTLNIPPSLHSVNEDKADDKDVTQERSSIELSHCDNLSNPPHEGEVQESMNDEPMTKQNEMKKNSSGKLAAKTKNEIPKKTKAKQRRKPQIKKKRLQRNVNCKSVSKVPFWKGNISTTQRCAKKLKNNQSIASQIMLGNKLPIFDLNHSSDIYNPKSDASNASAVIKLDRLEVRGKKQTSIKDFFNITSKKKNNSGNKNKDVAPNNSSANPQVKNNLVRVMDVKNSPNIATRNKRRFVRGRKTEIIAHEVSSSDSENEQIAPKLHTPLSRPNRKKMIASSSSSSEESINNISVRRSRKSKSIRISDDESEKSDVDGDVEGFQSDDKLTPPPASIRKSKRSSRPALQRKSKTVSYKQEDDSSSDSNELRSDIALTNDTPQTPKNQSSLTNHMHSPVYKSARSPCSKLFSPSVYVHETKESAFDFNSVSKLPSVRVRLTDVFSESNTSRDSVLKKCYVALERINISEKDYSKCSDVISYNHHKEDNILERTASLFTSRRASLLCQERVLEECDCTEIIPFKKLINDRNCLSCYKLGEGVYGEVFKCEFQDEPFPLALKIVPVNGKLIVNNEKQKTFQEVFSEVICSRELSRLRENERNSTDGFIKLHKMFCVEGIFPDILMTAWDVFDEERTSENDRPHIFPDDQRYLVFAYIDGGIDVEHYQFHHAAQALSVVQQVALSLAVGEQALHFEHRDLHWGNVLVCKTNDEDISAVLNGERITVKSYGVKAYIIDFTLSRLTKGKFTLYQNLALDPDLFTMDSSEDYQFEIYKMMRKATLDEWHLFVPTTNVHWLHYLVDKFLTKIKYERTRTKVHKQRRVMLSRLRNCILEYDSCFSFVTDCL